MIKYDNNSLHLTNILTFLVNMSIQNIMPQSHKVFTFLKHHLVLTTHFLLYLSLFSIFPLIKIGTIDSI